MTRTPAYAWLSPLFLVGCASVWGFDDLTVGDGGAASHIQDDANAASLDAATDSLDESAAGDSAGSPDTGSGTCGSTSSILNCGACGVACDTTRSLGAMCAGSTCTYSRCATGWSDCNTTPPDKDGCETHGPCGGTGDAGADGGMEAGGCQIMHSNGAGQSFTDCIPLGTHDQAQAQKACAAYNLGSCTLQAVSCNDAAVADAICECAGPPPLARCWEYAGPYVGAVFAPVVFGGLCLPCPTTAPASWN